MLEDQPPDQVRCKQSLPDDQIEGECTDDGFERTKVDRLRIGVIREAAITADRGWFMEEFND